MITNLVIIISWVFIGLICSIFNFLISRSRRQRDWDDVLQAESESDILFIWSTRGLAKKSRRYPSSMAMKAREVERKNRQTMIEMTRKKPVWDDEKSIAELKKNRL